MARKNSLIVFLLSLLFVFSLVSVVSALVVEDVVLFGEFDELGHPLGEQLVFFSGEDDAVFLWFNVTDIHVNDSLVFEYRSPSGDVYQVEEWVTPSWMVDGSMYDRFVGMEIMGSPAADMPGTWVIEVSVNDVWWGDVSFELEEGSSDSVIRGFYIHVVDVKPVGEVVIGENVTVDIGVEYKFPIKSPFVPSVFDEDFELRGEVSDEIQGLGEETYRVSMRTQPGDENGSFYAVALYFIDGNWTFMEPGGFKSFTLSGGVPGVPGGFEVPGLDLDEVGGALNETLNRGLGLLEDFEVPSEVGDIEESIMELIGVPGFPVVALVVGLVLVGVFLRRV